VKLDKAMREEGFKIVFLLRLSPVFPFALTTLMLGLTEIPTSTHFVGALATL
jgi:uncharacterized membrane protein YdjX (TVP38/TMEM64 family)